MMDHEDMKNHARKRLGRDIAAEKRQLRIARTTVGDVSQVQTELGRYRKRHAMDCGHARCGLCSVRRNPALKLKDKLTMQEKRAFDVEREGLAALVFTEAT